MSTRNPSPPPDYDGNAKQLDMIGDTTYSRRWLFSLLIKLLEKVNSETSATWLSSDEDPSRKESETELEEQLCCLWDLTVNRDVLKFLDEFEIVSIFNNALGSVQNPRLLEIIVGILGNLAYDPLACRKMSESESFIVRVINLLYTRDTPALIETCRLIQTVLASDEYRTPWLNEIRFQPEFFENVLFILKSSTNATLLIGTVRLIDVITREDDSLAEVWCGEHLLTAILIAQHQMKWLYGSEVEIIHRLLYTLSSNVNGVSALVNSFSEVLPTFGVYLRKVCEDAPHLIHFVTYYNSLRAIIPIIDVVIASLPCMDAMCCYLSDPHILPSLIHIACGCQKQKSELPLVRGILADLNVLYKDIIKSISSCLETMDDSNIAPLTTGELQWLANLESDDQFGFREAFVNCCLNDGDSETKACLISVCNRLKLPKILESVTTDG
ncbi:Protein saal1 [Schistosoma haematobium]|uniref:Protein saal1 n=1 Tax=Schistosoma haematobium TaxID=6185 RepID=A0A922LI87_SCHHA|nr:Protein saal1 [Schistosoma haematobium]KAH9585695.1 Protein saal1 [Schistosoma haematobium]